MSTRLPHPGRLFSTTVRRSCRLSSTTVQSRQQMFQDFLPFLTVVISQIEDLTDAHRVETFVKNDVADLSGQILHGMTRFFRAYDPADVVECQPVEPAVAVRWRSRVLLDPRWRQRFASHIVCVLQIIGRLCSTTTGALHGCLRERYTEHYTGPKMAGAKGQS